MKITALVENVGSFSEQADVKQIEKQEIRISINFFIGTPLFKFEYNFYHFVCKEKK